MNSITIAGNLTKDAEIRFLANGDPVAAFGIADNQGKDKSAIFWNCSLFGKRAESLAQYLLKGNPVTVSGNITEREWTDKDGTKRKSMYVRVTDIALQGGQRQESERPARPAAKPSSGGSGFDDMDSDIPF